MEIHEKKYCYEYPRPMVTVDVVCFWENSQGIRVLLVQRGREPYKGCWAIPGGFVNMDEDLETAARRELKEETHFEPAAMEQFYCFGDPGRDPRGRTISVAFLARIEDKDGTICQSILADDDASDAQWFDLGNLPKLAFDHDRIVQKAKETWDEWRAMGKI
jgi:8-oxo-dGTP diphosphatase